MQGKLCVVTGANSGLGKIMALDLARRGADVIMVARDRKKGQAALDEVRATAKGSCELELADLSLMKDVRALADRLRARPHIDVLLNNAGLYLAARRETEEGMEFSFAVNHLAPFLLTNLLRDRLKDARVITTSSAAHRSGRLRMDDLMMSRGWSGLRQYGNGKLANVLFTRELARRFAGDGVIASCLHPGGVNTGFAQDDANIIGSLIAAFGRFLLRTPEKGAETGIYLATAPEAGRINGEYFVDCKVKRTTAAGRDMDLARQLWDKSAELTGLA